MRSSKNLQKEILTHQQRLASNCCQVKPCKVTAIYLVPGAPYRGQPPLTQQSVFLLLPALEPPNKYPGTQYLSPFPSYFTRQASADSGKKTAAVRPTGRFGWDSFTVLAQPT